MWQRYVHPFSPWGFVTFFEELAHSAARQPACQPASLTRLQGSLWLTHALLGLYWMTSVLWRRKEAAKDCHHRKSYGSTCFDNSNYGMQNQKYKNIIFQCTLESGINVPLRLLIFWLFSRGYGLIPDFIEPI